MRNSPLRIRSRRALALPLPLAALALGLLAPALAGAASRSRPGSPTRSRIEIVKGKLKFVAPATVTEGDELEIVNETNPKQVGPHTFSLVTKGSLPKTAEARKNCFTPKHICLSIAKWHGLQQTRRSHHQPGQGRRRRLEHDGLA